MNLCVVSAMQWHARAAHVSQALEQLAHSSTRLTIIVDSATIDRIPLATGGAAHAHGALAVALLPDHPTEPLRMPAALGPESILLVDCSGLEHAGLLQAAMQLRRTLFWQSAWPRLMAWAVDDEQLSHAAAMLDGTFHIRPVDAEALGGRRRSWRFWATALALRLLGPRGH